MREIWMTATVAAALVFAAGCGGESYPTTYPVTGTVTHNGAPVEGATVTFVPAGEQSSAVAKTDSTGVYQLTTFSSGDGAEPGQYKIKVVKYDGAPTSEEVITMEEANTGEEDLSQMNYEPEANVRETEPKNLLPGKYSQDHTTPLSFTVTEGENVFDIALDAG